MRSRVVAGIGLLIAALGVVTATDAVSLRELARAADVPVLSHAILAARSAMPSSLAHLLEPLTAVLGSAVMALPRARSRR